MHDAPYFRAQADLCLQIARYMSDRAAVEGLRSEAADCIARAVAAEVRSAARRKPKIPAALT